MKTPLLSNPAARRLFLHRHGLGETPAGPAKGDDLARLIDRIGFVQLDSINTVERAHHMILFARRPSYRPPALDRLQNRDRKVFEHWTHDASVLPMALFPHWRHRFRSFEATRAERWRAWLGGDAHERMLDQVLDHIAAHGPVTTTDVGKDETRSKGGWWEWHPSKAALEWLWQCGKISIARRESFRKVYDLTENVIPPEFLAKETSSEETLDWACSSALDRLGFATSGEIAAYWRAISPAEARDWCRRSEALGLIVPIEVEGADGSRRVSFARPGVVEEAAGLPEPPARLRVLSPFDPALRDRARAERLFNFFYRIEVFVPEPKRTYGYYVFPLLEGARIVGRIDMKARRDTGALVVRALWPERGVIFGAGRLRRVQTELDRMAVFSRCDRVSYEDGWLREPL
jgi:uncharacterized protein YcaQ